MSIRDIVIKSEYRSLIDNVAKDFYIPLLQQATKYKRAVGFFSSSALVEISKGIAQFAKNGGKIMLVASPYLSDDDINAIRKGYELRESIIHKALVRELHEPRDIYEQERLNLLANLISDGILDIKIAFTENEKKMGMYHEKMGVISDDYGNKVAFSGSMNESATAMMINYEAIDVFCSWKSEFENDKVVAKENAFTSIWNDCEPNIRIIEFPDLKQELIERYKRTAVNFDIYEQEFDQNNMLLEEKTKFRIGAVIPKSVKLHDYQIQAIDAWEKNNYRGIFDMATGTGKTFTGLGAISRLCDITDDHVAIIIVCPYQHLVEQWAEDIKLFNLDPLIGYSGSPHKHYKKKFKNLVYDFNLGVKKIFCFVCTNATFASKDIQIEVQKLCGDVLLVVDEAHNFGATNISKTLTSVFKYRLALSATLERHNDEEGTTVLKNYFGEKCIEYNLEKAIKEKKLTQYYYHPVLVYLSERELEKYTMLTLELGRCIVGGRNGETHLNQKGKIIALQRSRIVAGAIAKIHKLSELIQDYREDTHILVYCGATKLLDQGYDDDSEEIKQIDAITRMLGNELNMKVARFTAREDSEQRKIRKKKFLSGDIQALVAIKCLDEGVNIPKIRTAFILASTTNPKEYIQRRGRVLRLADGKEFATIYDFITLPRELDVVTQLSSVEMQKDKSLVKNEIKRMIEFKELALNPYDSDKIINDIIETYGLYEDINDKEEILY